MSSNKSQNKQRMQRSFNPISDFTSKYCPEKRGEYCKKTALLCSQTHYNDCPIFKGQNTLRSW